MAQIYSSFGLRWGGRKPNPNDLTVASADGMQIATANLPAEGLIAFWATDFCGRFLGCGGGMGIIALSGPRLKKKRRCFWACAHWTRFRDMGGLWRDQVSRMHRQAEGGKI